LADESAKNLSQPLLAGLFKAKFRTEAGSPLYKVFNDLRREDNKSSSQMPF
jgi:hypothetical protein